MDEAMGEPTGTRLHDMYRDLELCTRCGELRGAVEWTDGREQRRLLQECACQRALRPAESPRWWGFDFNVVAELCRVCGSAVLPSGTRFSPPMCTECRARGLRLRSDTDLDGLREWSREALTRNLIDAGLAHRSVVPLADYLEVVELVDRGRRVDECIMFLDLGTVTD
jgi:hypothetical protein